MILRRPLNEFFKFTAKPMFANRRQRAIMVSTRNPFIQPLIGQTPLYFLLAQASYTSASCHLFLYRQLDMSASDGITRFSKILMNKLLPLLRKPYISLGMG